MYDLIIIGGGPAGLTAAIYALRKRINVLVVSRDLGGKTQWRLALPWIEDYQVIRGLDIVNKFRSELEYLNFARHMEPVDRIDKAGEEFVVRTRGGGELRTKAVILATGTKQQRLTVPGEKDYIMRGLCYSALSYAPLFIDRETVVVGDGDLALRSAAELSTVAKHVHLIGASGKVLETALGKKLKGSNNVTILEQYTVTEVPTATGDAEPVQQRHGCHRGQTRVGWGRVGHRGPAFGRRPGGDHCHRQRLGHQRGKSR